MNGFMWEGQPVRWGLHEIGHELSAFYDIVHGEGLAILIPHWMDFALREETVDKFAEYGINVWDLDAFLDKWGIAKTAIERTRAFFRDELKNPTALREVGITEDNHFPAMEKRAAAIIEGCFVPMHENDIIRLLKACL